MNENRLPGIIKKMLDKNKHTPVLVEGVHDIGSLHKLGFSGKIIKINRGISLELLSQKISEAYDEVILLTDFDRTGISLKKNMETRLTSYGVMVDNELWTHIYENYNLKSVEDLPWLMDQIDH